MKTVVFDTESDGLYHDATKIWVMGWTDNGKDYHTTTRYDRIKEVLESYDCAVCHNSFTHDFPLLKKLGIIDYKGLKIDSLYLSWYLSPGRNEHGLESYGKDFGVPKVYVDPDDWTNLDVELAKKRVVEDVKINWLVWKNQLNILERLYE